MMKLTAVLGLLSLLLFHTQAEGEQCFTEEEMMEKNFEMWEMCTKPQEKPVFLTVPNGYVRIFPSVVMVKKCSGHGCVLGNRITCTETKAACLNKTNTTKVVKVQAWDRYGNITCVKKEVLEDSSCECRCQNTCGRNQELDNSTCDCKCREDAEKNCLGQFDMETCTCIDFYYYLRKGNVLTNAADY